MLLYHILICGSKVSYWPWCGTSCPVAFPTPLCKQNIYFACLFCPSHFG